MRYAEFFKRRLIRLHPMVIMGAVIGAVTFCIQGRVQWNGSSVSVSMVMLALLLNMFLLPALPGSRAEVRGNGEMFPLNGPNWSLFFEYIGNLLYAFFVHRLSTKALSVLVVVLGICLTLFAVLNFSGYGHIGVGWTLADYNFPGGLIRMMFSYSVGLLMSRVFKPMRIRGAFWICSLVLLTLLSMPHVGGMGNLWMNGVYDSVCVIFIFPMLVYLAASGSTTDKNSTAICKFLGDISYPIYVVHYPFMYLFFAWVWRDKVPFSEAWPFALLVVATSVVLAYLSLKLYDEPVRKWLSRKFLAKK
jgi:peptidoglycan/LPS O-acetylase OafA/YrhL